MSDTDPTWAGAWVADRLGLTITPVAELAELAGLAVRRNPRRAHLVVSRVLGKHIPVPPRLAIGAGCLLGEQAAAVLAAGAGGVDHSGRVAVLGYAETATALGHLVADAFPMARYAHTTRRAVPGATPALRFDEAHSHAREHLLLPADPDWLAGPEPLVIVDDELTTGATVIATVRAVQAAYPRERYLVATLLDLRSPADRAALAATADALGVRIDVVALATAELRTPADVLDRGARLVADYDAGDPDPTPPPASTPEVGSDGGRPPAPIARIDPDWPADLPTGGRHGFAADQRARLSGSIVATAEAIAAGPARAWFTGGGRLLVLGTEEFMYTPLRIADRLAAMRRGPVGFASTTRSPVVPVDEPGYAVRTRLSFAAHDGTGAGTRFAYNVAPAGGAAGFDHVVIVVDDAGDTPRLWDEHGLVEAVRRVCGSVSVAVLPTHRPEHLGREAATVATSASASTSAGASAGGGHR